METGGKTSMRSEDRKGEGSASQLILSSVFVSAARHGETFDDRTTVYLSP